MNNTINGMCSDGIPHFLGFIDFSIAPTLLYYAYVPILVFTVIFSIFILRQKKGNIVNKLFFFISLLFAFWILNIFLQWIAIPNRIIFTAWQFTALFELPIFLLSIYFIDSFSTQKDISLIKKSFLLILFLPVLLFLFSKLNISSYDYELCQGTVGALWIYVYAIEILSVVVIGIHGLILHGREKKDPVHRKRILMLTLGLVWFLGIFSFSNIFGELLGDYEINLVGPIGMVVFLGLVTYLIVKYKAFNAKMLGAQALVLGLMLFIGSQFFFIKNNINFFLNGVTFLFIIVAGQLLIKSVKKEIEQKEELLKINIQLKDLIQQRESLVHLITHKVKGSFTRTKYIFAEMLNDSFGPMTPEMKKMAQTGFESDNTGIQTIDMVLNASNLNSGIVKYDMKKINLKDVVLIAITEKTISAEAKGLKIEKEIGAEEFNILGDVFWLKEVANNFIDNSIKYSNTGTIIVGLKKVDSKVIFSVKDTGVGITEEDKRNLFKEGGRGKESVKMNVDSTGYGLYSVKLIVDAHGGRVWAESEGKDKGSTFFVELGAV